MTFVIRHTRVDGYHKNMVADEKRLECQKKTLDMEKEKYV